MMPFESRRIRVTTHNMETFAHLPVFGDIESGSELRASAPEA
jgi:hypothetical protein